MSGIQNHPALHGWRLRAMLLIVLLSAIGYLAFSLWGGWHQVTTALAKVGILGTLIALSLSLFNYLVRFFRWQKFLKKLGHVVYWPESLRIYLAGFGLTIIPGKAGETIRSVFLKKHHVSYPESLAAFFSEQLSNMISMILLVSLGLWSYPKTQPVIIILGVLIVTILIFIQQKNWLKSFEILAQRKFPKTISRLITSSIEIVLHSTRCFTLPMLIYGISLGLIAWGAEGVAFYYIMHVIGSDIPFQTALFIYAFSMLVGAISFLPGGLGGTEATMVSLLILGHIAQPQAVAATVLIRLATLWFAVAVGVIAMAIPERVRKFE